MTEFLAMSPPKLRSLWVTLDLQPGDALDLHIFLDHFVVEIFANRHTCLVTRIYPVDAGSDHLGLFADGSGVMIDVLDVWKLNSIWE